MKKFIMRLLVSGISIYIIAYFVEGIRVDSIESTAIAAVVLGLVNTFVKPIILFFTIPINILTLGLFTFVLNGVVLYFTAMVVEGFTIESFLYAIIGAILLSISNVILSSLLGVKR